MAAASAKSPSSGATSASPRRQSSTSPVDSEHRNPLAPDDGDDDVEQESSYVCFGKGGESYKLMRALGEFCETFCAKAELLDLDRRAGGVKEMVEDLLCSDKLDASGDAVDTIDAAHGGGLGLTFEREARAIGRQIAAATLRVLPSSGSMAGSFTDESRGSFAGRRLRRREDSMSLMNDSMLIGSTASLSGSHVQGTKPPALPKAAADTPAPSANDDEAYRSASSFPRGESIDVDDMSFARQQTSVPDHSPSGRIAPSNSGSTAGVSGDATSPETSPATATCRTVRTISVPNPLEQTLPPDQVEQASSPTFVGSPTGQDRRGRELMKPLAMMARMYIEASSKLWIVEKKLEAAETQRRKAEDQVKMLQQQHSSPPRPVPTPSMGAPNSTTASMSNIASASTQPSSFLLSRVASRARSSGNQSPTPGRSARIRRVSLTPSRSGVSDGGGGTLLDAPSMVRTSAVTEPSTDMQSGASAGSYASVALRGTGSTALRTSVKADIDISDFDGSMVLNQYLVCEELGAGAQGRVLLAYDTTNNDTRAIKEIPRPKKSDDAAMTRLRHEVAIMKRVRHRNVVALYEVIDDPEANAMYLVMQYIEHGPVATLSPVDATLPQVPPIRLASFARQLCAGLHYLHQRNVVHRDIKPENILLGQNDQVFLADFGISSFVDMDAAITLIQSASSVLGMAGQQSLPDAIAVTEPTAQAADLVADSVANLDPSRSDFSRGNIRREDLGTPAFQAPEIIAGKHDNVFEPADVWALGMSLYTLLYGKLPFTLNYGYFRAVLDEEISFPHRVPTEHDPLLSPGSRAASAASEPLENYDEWCYLLRSMLEKDPKKRITAEVAHRRAKALDQNYQQDVLRFSLKGPDLESAISKRTAGQGGVANATSLAFGVPSLAIPEASVADSTT